jgi:uncharacterized protein
MPDTVRAAEVTVRLVDSLQSVSAEAWDGLLLPNDSPFARYAWLRTLEETGCVSESTGWSPLHALVYEGETLVAAMPLYLKRHSQGEFVFDRAWADASHQMGDAYYPKLVCAIPFTPATGGRVFGAKTLHRAHVLALAEVVIAFIESNPVSSCHVLFPHKETHDLFVEAGFLSRVGVQYQFDNLAYASFEAFLTSLPTKKRTQLRRERKEMAARNITIQTYGGDDLTPAHIDAMHRYYAATVDKFYYGNRYINRDFFDAIVPKFKEHLRWVFAEQDGKSIAGAFNVQSENILYGRYWGSDVDVPFLHFNVCYYHGIEECLKHGLTRFEPGAGGEHKHVRGFLPHLTYSAHYVKSGALRRALLPFLAREQQAVRAYVEKDAPA